jgi:hypothetical protein
VPYSGYDDVVARCYRDVVESRKQAIMLLISMNINGGGSIIPAPARRKYP